MASTCRPATPEPSPVGLACGTPKALLKAISARDLQAVATALERTEDLPTLSDLVGRFFHYGYQRLMRVITAIGPEGAHCSRPASETESSPRAP